jgi:hypothetical protein
MWDFVMDKSGAGAGFLRELRFPLPIYIPSAFPQSSSLSPEADTIGQEWPTTPPKKNKQTKNMVLRRCYCLEGESWQFWLIQVLARESYSKQRSYTRQNCSRPNRTYTKLDLFQSWRIPRYHCTELPATIHKSSSAFHVEVRKRIFILHGRDFKGMFLYSTYDFTPSLIIWVFLECLKKGEAVNIHRHIAPFLWFRKQSRMKTAKYFFL